MEQASEFVQVEAGLEGVLEELRRREPIFHTTAFGLTAAERERAMDSAYWEVGASGRRYSRRFIQQRLAEKPPVEAEAAGWRCSDFGLRRLGAETYLLTYTLEQGKRVTRRATIWKKTDGTWQILYHQGTVVTGEDDTVP
ncbi:MAG: DUF4440 domain-containing protein [Acidobacteriaceae bacterium]